MDNYSQHQKDAGRYQRTPNTRLRDIMEWLDYNKVVPGDVHLQLWLALAFLLVCLVNTVGLLLAKFLRRSSEIGVRRALGASNNTQGVQVAIPPERPLAMAPGAGAGDRSADRSPASCTASGSATRIGRR